MDSKPVTTSPAPTKTKHTRRSMTPQRLLRGIYDACETADIGIEEKIDTLVQVLKEEIIADVTGA